MNTTKSSSRYRPVYIPILEHAWQQVHNSSPQGRLFLAIQGVSGSGKLETVKHWCSVEHTQREFLFSDGCKLTNGYFGGFYTLFLSIFKDAEIRCPEIIQRHEQSIKRLFPSLPCSVYQIPKDLTNLSTQGERTRFYHHEYQEKLLNGIYEFLLDYCRSESATFTLVIDNADQISPTVKTFLQIIGRREKLSKYLSIVLLFDQPVALSIKKYCYVVEFSPLDLNEAAELIRCSDRFAKLHSRQIELYWMLSEGNIAKLLALLECHSVGVNIPSYLTYESYLDFYLGVIGDSYRYNLLREYIAAHCVSDDPISIHNYETYDNTTKSLLHREQIEELKVENNDEQLIRLIHYLSLDTPTEQVIELSPIMIKLQEIGLYDTWFDIFSKYYTDLKLRVLPDGDQIHNIAFIRMAFILYSLGLAKLSVPYLDLFYNHFPESLSTPTVLYSQSMTYGRYQIPVDLEKAEKYAILNLEKIDGIFKNHPKYVYIKVFAENALAYIRARQGRFPEALELCTSGIEKMSEIYGDQKYKLHQSILVYNTGQIYELIGDFQKAYDTYRQAIDLDPYYGEYYNDLANLLQKHNRVEESLEYYQKAIDLCPPYYEAHLNRGGLYEDIEELHASEKDYLRVIELKPDESRAYVRLGIICFGQGFYDKALSMLNLALYYNPRDAQAYNNRALVYQELGQILEAREDLNSSIRLDPKLSEAYNNRAVLLFNAELLDESLVDLDTAIALLPDSDYFLNRGTLHQRMKHLEKALSDFALAKEHGATDEQIEALIQETASSATT